VEVENNATEETVVMPSATKVPVEAVEPQVSALSDAGFERYECLEDGSRKFWEVKVEGASYTVRYGRIGTAGQTLTKQFIDEPAARHEMEKVRAKKEEKGYRRV
jgi:predicted DNA-binding WGR domain protein